LKSVTVARNYAEALFAAGEAKGQAEEFGALIDAVAGAVAADERIAVALESPRVSKGVKGRILERALRGEAPAEFVRFLQAVVRRGRQGLFGEIAQEYLILLDKQLNRVHAGVTLAQAPDARTETEIVTRLTKALGREVRAHFRTDRNIVGGVVVRVGDRILDGSVRRRLMALKRRMLTGE
jgi:F-type H+-transporting ATPase subunit delta